MCCAQGSGGKLKARPRKPGLGVKAGTHSLGLGRGRDALLCVPEGYSAPAPLIVSLHGAGGSEKGGLNIVRTQAEEFGVLVLAPASRGSTWDVIETGDFGPDVAFIDKALDWTFDRCAVSRVAVGGFSDGASYALSLGLTNGDLFGDILAFSPGFMRPAALTGRPRIYVSHGTKDQVLPIDVCSRRLVPKLKDAGYDVTYDEFDGPHRVPPELARRAVSRFEAR
jgi:phospholipase/carboxylesterase